MRLSKENVDQKIIKLYESGWSFRQLQKRYHKSPNLFRLVTLQQANVPRPQHLAGEYGYISPLSQHLHHGPEAIRRCICGLSQRPDAEVCVRSCLLFQCFNQRCQCGCEWTAFSRIDFGTFIFIKFDVVNAA